MHAGVPRLTFWQKTVYGFGDLVIAIRLTAFQFYLLPLYTDVVLLPPALAGLGKMLGFVWDGVNDPLTGYVSDRTRSRFGRRRPYLIGAALPLGLTFGLLWTPPAQPGPMLGFLYMVGAFMVYDTFFTFYATPYLALGAELSDDYHERTQLSASRSFFHVLGLFAGGVIPGAILARYASAPATGFAVAGIGLGAFMTVVALATGLLTRETSRAGGAAGTMSWRTFFGGLVSALANRPFRVMMVTFALILLAGGLTQTLVPYAFRYWLDMPQLVGSVIAIYLGASVLSLPLWTRLARGIGKDRALRLCMLWSVTMLVATPFVLAPGMSLVRLSCYLVMAGLGSGGWAVLPVAITADIVDHDELETGQRREGAFFGFWTLAMKLSAALANGVVGVALELFGYVPNVAQAPHTILGIKLLYGPVPAVLMLAALIVFLRFPLTRERHHAVQEALAVRRRT
jgi:glycoside/pentoside/hexuronide:cation symporter, GPH family